MNNKVAAISKTMELPGDKYLVLKSKFLSLQKQELGDCDLCVKFAHFLSNFITLEIQYNTYLIDRSS